MKMLQQFLVEYNIFAPEDEAIRYMGTDNDSALDLDNPDLEDDMGMDGVIGVEPEPVSEPESNLMALPDGTEKYEAYLKKKGILDANGKPVPPPPEELESEVAAPAAICDCGGDCAACANDPALEPVEEIVPEDQPIEPQGQLEPIEGDPEDEDEIEFKF